MDTRTYSLSFPARRNNNSLDAAAMTDYADLILSLRHQQGDIIHREADAAIESLLDERERLLACIRAADEVCSVTEHVIGAVPVTMIERYNAARRALEGEK